LKPDEYHRKKASQAGIYNFYQGQEEFCFAIKFTKNFNVFYLNETNRD